MKAHVPALVCVALMSLGQPAGAQTTDTAPEAADDGQIDLSPLLGNDQTPVPDEPTVEQAEPTTETDAEVEAAVEDPVADEPVDDPLAESAAADAELPLYLRAEGPGPEPGDRPAARDVFYPVTGDAGQGIRRLSGEYDEIVLNVTVPPGATVDRFVISYRNSINILGETSRITVLQDGAEIASWSPEAPGDFEQVSLPTDSLATGTNRITVRAEQSHRIFCGPEASFAIWTDIDPATSGVAVTSGESDSDIAAFRLAAAAQVGSGAPVPVVTTLALTTGATRDLERRISSLGAGSGARITVQSPYAPDIAEAAIARISILPADDVPASASLPRVVTGPQGGLILVMSEDTPAATLDGILPLAAGVTGPTVVTPGAGTALSDLADADVILRSRYSRRDISFRLPDDWMLISAQQARLDLLYRYTEGLPEGALMLVKVNDTTVRLLPLYGQGGMVLPQLPVGFPTRLLRPGANEISFEAIIPGDPPDLPCPRIEAPLVEISGDSLLSVPTSPRMWFPRLSRSLFSLAPEGMSLVPALVGNPRGEAVLSALYVGIQAIEADPDMVEPATLTIGSLSSLDQVPLEALGVDRLAMEQMLTPRSTETGPVTEAETRFTLPTLSTRSYGDRARDFTSSTWAGVRGLAWPGDPPLSEWVAGRNGMAFVFMADASRPQDLWLVLSPSADPGDVARALASGRADPFGPDGQASLLMADGTWQNWQPATARPELLEPLTISNARAVAGNYASWSPVYFVAILATLMSVSVLLGLSFVVRTRGARKR